MESELSHRIRWYTLALKEERKTIITAMNCYIKSLDDQMNKMIAAHTPIPISMEHEMNAAKQFIQSMPWKLENGEIISTGEILAREVTGMCDDIREILSKHIKK